MRWHMESAFSDEELLQAYYWHVALMTQLLNDFSQLGPRDILQTRFNVKQMPKYRYAFTSPVDGLPIAGVSPQDWYNAALAQLQA